MNDSVHGRGALLDEQTAITTLAQLLLNEQTMGDIPGKVAKLAKNSIPGADEVSITLINPGGPHTVAFTSDMAMSLDQRQYKSGQGPCVDAANAGRTVVINDTATDQSYPDFARYAHQSGVGSTLSVSLALPTGSFGSLNMYADGNVTRAEVAPVVVGPWPGHDNQNGMAESFASCAAVILANAAQYADSVALAEQLRQALQSRAVIEQAKGILIRDTHCSAEQAFSMLIKASNRSNRKLRDVARSLVQASQRDS